MNRWPVLVLICLSLVACKREDTSSQQGTPANPVPPSSDVEQLSGPSRTTGVFLKSLQQGNLSKAVDQMSKWNTAQNAIYSALLDNNAVAEALYGKLQFTMGKAEVQGDQATVNLKLSNVHLAKGLAQKWTTAIAQNLSGVVSGKIQAQDVFQQIVTDASKDTKLERFDYSGKVHLKKVQGQWKIQPDAELLNTITADLLKPIQDFFSRIAPKNP